MGKALSWCTASRQEHPSPESRDSTIRYKGSRSQPQQARRPSRLSPLSQAMITPSFGPAPVMLVGNKCDRVTEREVSTQEGSALAKQLNCEFVEASAKNCVNVEKAFYDVVRQLRKQRSIAPRSQPTGLHEGVYQSRTAKPPKNVRIR